MIDNGKDTRQSQGAVAGGRVGQSVGQRLVGIRCTRHPGGLIDGLGITLFRCFPFAA